MKNTVLTNRKLVKRKLFCVKTERGAIPSKPLPTVVSPSQSPRCDLPDVITKINYDDGSYEQTPFKDGRATSSPKVDRRRHEIVGNQSLHLRAAMVKY